MNEFLGGFKIHGDEEPHSGNSNGQMPVFPMGAPPRGSEWDHTQAEWPSKKVSDSSTPGIVKDQDLLTF